MLYFALITLLIDESTYVITYLGKVAVFCYPFICISQITSLQFVGC